MSATIYHAESLFRRYDDEFFEKLCAEIEQGNLLPLLSRDTQEELRADMRMAARNQDRPVWEAKRDECRK